MELYIGGCAQGKLGAVREELSLSGRREGGVWEAAELFGEPGRLEELKRSMREPDMRESDMREPDMRESDMREPDMRESAEGEAKEKAFARQDRVWIINHLHLAVKEMTGSGEEYREGDQEELVIRLAGELEELDRYGEVIVISDEVGNGIVPAEPAQRAYREIAGRLLIRLASRAERVERIVCGLRQRLK